MKKGLLLLLLLLSAATGLTAQDASEKKRLARELFDHHRYEEALALLTASRQLSREDKEARFIIALCHYQLNELEAAMDVLQELINEEKWPYPECWLFAGKIYHARHEFQKAAEYYKSYLGLLDFNAPNRRLVWEDIKRCALGMRVQYDEPNAFVENLGTGVNTKYDEFAPLLSPNHHDKLYFSSAREGSNGGLRSRAGLPDQRLGQYFSDIYSCRMENGVWGQVNAMHYLLNSPRHDVLLDFGGDGVVLYYQKGLELGQGDILIDTFASADQRVLTSNPFIAPVNGGVGDRDLYFYNDTLLFFASKRPGGQGGYDIYQSRLHHGSWTIPENLGPEVNTPFDEVSPFLSRNGQVLYFSSTRSDLSIGGFDVLKSMYNYKTKRWMKPEHLNIPINSAGDDTHFRLSRDGFTAFFASSRKDGQGKRDLYVAYFNDFLEEQEAPLTYNAPPQKTPPRLSESRDLRLDIPRTPNTPKDTAATESPRIAPLWFPAGENTIDAEHRQSLQEIAATLKATPGARIVITGYSPAAGAGKPAFDRAIDAAEKAAAYLEKQGVARQAIYKRGLLATWDGAAADETIVAFHFAGSHGQSPKVGSPTELKSSFSTPPLPNRGLMYKVQFAAAMRNTFTSPIMSEFDYPMIEKNPDSEFYRFTVGAEKTVAAARKLQKKVAAAGRSSAYIVAYVDGVRLGKGEEKSYVENYPDLINLY